MTWDRVSFGGPAVFQARDRGVQLEALSPVFIETILSTSISISIICVSPGLTRTSNEF